MALILYLVGGSGALSQQLQGTAALSISESDAEEEKGHGQVTREKSPGENQMLPSLCNTYQ